jgi:probable AcnD-accessory protein PrpF
MNATSRQRSIKALYMRGGTSKGVFFLPEDLPSDPQHRDAVLLRVAGSPDPYGKQIDGMGSATSSTSKVVIVGKSARPDCDIDYLFGQVSIDAPMVDWSGNCGNLTAAVGPFAIHRGLVQAPRDGVVTVHVWQANIGKKIIVHVPMQDGEVVELGDFELDGVTFPAAEIKIEFLDPGADDDGGRQAGGAMFPTGRSIEMLDVPGIGRIEATLINAGNPAVFVAASSLGLRGAELQDEINNDVALLARCETIRAHAAVAMGLAASAAEASATRQHTPKLAFFSSPADYLASNGKTVRAGDIDIVARIFSMGKLHHAMTGTGAVGVAAAAAVPDTVVSRILNGARAGIRFGHPSGALSVGAEAHEQDGGWQVSKVSMSRSARRLMEGAVFVPAATFGSAS